MSPVVLGIDTSASVCAGLARDGEILASGVVDDSRAHAEQLMPLVGRVVAEAGIGGLADVESIAVGVGPGPFTGLRVGVVAAAVLAEALGVGIRGVCSLDVLARQAVAGGVLNDRPRERSEADAAAVPSFIVATDARRKEWYWATYAADGRRVEGPFVTAPDQVPDLPRVGPVTDTPLELDAGVLAAISADLPEAGLEPLYLRRPDAEVPTTRKSTLLPPKLVPRRIR